MSCRAQQSRRGPAPASSCPLRPPFQPTLPTTLRQLRTPARALPLSRRHACSTASLSSPRLASSRSARCSRPPPHLPAPPARRFCSHRRARTCRWPCFTILQSLQRRACT
jgi:hypothetical protein